MIEQIVSAVVRSQVGNLKKRTAGAVLEGVGLGLIGLAVVFLFLGLYLLLAQEMARWLAALLVAAFAAAAAAVVMTVGAQLLSREKKRQGGGLEELVKQVAALAAKRSAPREQPAVKAGSAPGAGEGKGTDSPFLLVASALAAGIVLGRSTKR